MPISTVLLHARVAFLLVAHLLVIFGQEAVHTDPPVAVGSAGAALSAHDCGASEKHISPDALHGCPTCIHQLQKIGYPPTVVAITPVLVGVAVPPPAACLRAPRHPLYHSGLRGPPCA